MNKKNNILKVGMITIIGNLLLAISKFITGLLSSSNSLISDSIHSLSDFLSTIVVIIGVHISKKQADNDHPYGHERYECVSALLLAFLLFLVVYIMFSSNIKMLFIKSTYNVSILSFTITIISILSKETMFWYTKKAADKLQSDALKADAWHHRSDALSSIVTLIGLIGIKVKIYYIDTIAALIICIIIFKVAINIFIESIDKMIDKSCSKEIIEEFKNLILSNKEIVRIDTIKTRMFSNRIYIDVEVSVDRLLSLLEAHEIAHKIHDQIEQEYSSVKHCMVHVNPDN